MIGLEDPLNIYIDSCYCTAYSLRALLIFFLDLRITFPGLIKLNLLKFHLFPTATPPRMLMVGVGNAVVKNLC